MQRLGFYKTKPKRFVTWTPPTGTRFQSFLFENEDFFSPVRRSVYMYTKEIRLKTGI